MAREMLTNAEAELERALEQTDDDEARYHIRQAAQRVVAAKSEQEN